MTTKQLAELLQDLLERETDHETRTFEEAEVLTRDDGFEVLLSDMRTAFTVKVMESRR